MKKVIFCFILIVITFTLCCCKTETKTIKEKGDTLKNGTETYYINKYSNQNDKLVNSKRYDINDNLIEEYEYNYSYDINGKLYRIIKKDIIKGNKCETNYNKFNQKTEQIYYSNKNIIYKKYCFFKNGLIKKEYRYSQGNEIGYIIYDYYADNQIKNKTEYNINGKTLKITTYYKNNLLFQIKEFDNNGFIKSTTIYSYKDEKLTKVSVYDNDFNLIQITDYTKTPKEVIKYNIVQKE